MIVFIILGAVSAAIMLLYGVRDLTSSARQRRRALAAAESLARPGDDGTWLDKFEDRVEAIREASGEELAARTDLEDLASQWDIPNADKPYASP